MIAHQFDRNRHGRIFCSRAPKPERSAIHGQKITEDRISQTALLADFLIKSGGKGSTAQNVIEHKRGIVFRVVAVEALLPKQHAALRVILLHNDHFTRCGRFCFRDGKGFGSLWQNAEGLVEQDLQFICCNISHNTNDQLISRQTSRHECPKIIFGYGGHALSGTPELTCVGMTRKGRLPKHALGDGIRIIGPGCDSRQNLRSNSFHCICIEPRFGQCQTKQVERLITIARERLQASTKIIA